MVDYDLFRFGVVLATTALYFQWFYMAKDDFNADD